MQCAAGHETCNMLLTNEDTLNKKNFYLCPTCQREIVIIYEGHKKSSIEVIKRGVYERDIEPNEKIAAIFDGARRRNKEIEDIKNRTIMQCANGHSPVNMVYICPSNMNLYWLWYQCPQCYEKKLYTNDGIFNEKRGREWEEKAKEESRKAYLRQQEDEKRKIIEEEKKIEIIKQQRIERNKKNEEESKLREFNKLKELEIKIKKKTNNLFFLFLTSGLLYLIEIGWIKGDNKFIFGSIFIIGSIFNIILYLGLLQTLSDELFFIKSAFVFHKQEAKLLASRYKVRFSYLFILLVIINLIIIGLNFSVDVVGIRTVSIISFGLTTFAWPIGMLSENLF